MKGPINGFEEFQEIVFWQQLNKQMIEHKEKGKSVSEENQDGLQRFCFESKLFQVITQDPLFDDIPVALITDFSNIKFLTLNNSSWEECLERLVPNAFVLSMEMALADAFDVITDYDVKHGLFNSEPEEDDEDLYGFISRYDSVLPEEQRDLNGLLQDLYGLKAEALRRIFQQAEIQKTVRLDGPAMILDLGSLDNGPDLIGLYNELFCRKALARIEKVTSAANVFNDMEVLNLLSTAASAPGQKTSVKDFITHERDLFLRRQELMGKFRLLLATMENPPHDLHIKISDLAPLSFLKSPFPAI